MEETVRETLGDDPVLGPLVDRYGVVDLTPAPDPFERLIRSIISQQVSTAAASAIADRLFDRVEVTPDALVDADTADLRDAGLSPQKARYTREIARAFRDRGYTRDAFAGMDDAAVVDELTGITGVGPWTAKMFLMFALGRPDVFPVEDLGIRRAMAAAVDPSLSRPEMVAHAEAWRPVRSYAALYLWRSID